MRAYGADVTVERGTAAAGNPATRVLDLHTPAGEPVIAVEEGPNGWLIDAPEYGRQLVAPDGRRITVSGTDSAPGRLLVAQSLPTAAALQGRDLFHASALRTPAGVIALSGPSGSGKSTLARALADAGVGVPFCDDVLAVDGDMTAYAGPTVRDDPTSVPEPDTAPLAALVLLDRVATPGGVTLAPPDEAALFAELLAAAFIAHVQTQPRLLARLEICARLLRAGRASRLTIGRTATVAETAAAIAALLPEA